jgi:hypothetical protein
MICQYCSKPAKSLNSKVQHEIRCKENPARISLDYLKGNLSTYGKMGINPTPCKFCSKVYDNKIALSNHVTRCVLNPDRVIQIMTKEGKEKVRASNLIMNQRWADPAIRKKHSIAMKQAVDKNPESYTSSNRGRTKQIIVDGIKFQGQWEVDFYLWAKENGLEPRRPSKSFTYEWNGTRTYFPDFYIESKDLYVEVKGYETDRDRAKWLTFPKKLRIIKEAEIKQIREGTFVDL